MSATDVLARFGTWVLLRFVLALLVFVLLHLIRLPVLLLAAVLTGAMTRVDLAVTTAGPGSVDGEGTR
ncbi:hypothetical protein [Actinophytocola sediminis]